jgi:hypothetical protein
MQLGARPGATLRCGLKAGMLAGLALLAAACGGKAPATPPATPASTPVAQASSTPASAPGTRSTPSAVQTSSSVPETGERARTLPSQTTSRRRAHPAKAKTWAPSSPQPTISQAAYALVEAWSARNRPEALRDASPAAVAALFSRPYPPGGPQFRGCSTPPGNEPAACVYRLGNDLLTLTVRLGKGGYAVTSVVVES